MLFNNKKERTSDTPKREELKKNCTDKICMKIIQFEYT